jgi:4-amino-4-deoxy-L-arabinose transferase-like glycosyltransferase
LLLVLMICLRLVAATQAGLHDDEAYYWEWSRRLALSYYDHPPLVAYSIALFTAIFGRTSVAVHLPAIVFSLLTSLVLYRLVRLLFPDRNQLAWSVMVIFNAVPLASIGALFSTPDAPFAFFWILTVYLARRAIEGKPRFWYLAGISAGLGLLSKYNMVFFPVSLFVYLLTSTERNWLKRKEPYLALAIMFLLFTPVLLWNAQHHWASFQFHLSARHRWTFRPQLTLGRLALSQLTVSPLLLIACVAGLVRSCKRGLMGSDVHWYLFLCSAVVLIFFSMVGLVVLVNPNWFAAGYLTALILAADWLAEMRSRAFQVATVGLAAALSALIYLQASYLPVPMPQGLGTFTNQVQGWKEVGAKIREIQRTMPDPARVFAFSRRFQLSALAAFYTEDELEVTRLGGRPDQYDAWRDPASLRGRDAIFFCTEEYFVDPVGEYPFRNCQTAGDFSVVRHQKKLSTFFFWRCYDYQP